jgi:RNA polymerase sigma-70 factor (ECF subfamily)
MTLSRSKAAFAAAPPDATVDPAEESAVVARARGGDREAFGWLVERHQDRVYALAWRLCRGDRDHAEDLAQESFLRALRGLPEFRGDAAFSTWMHRIVLNLHLNRESSLAGRARRRQVSLGAGKDEDGPRLELPSRGPRPDEQAADSELLGRLRLAFDELDETRRVVVLLRDVEGRSYEEIAALLEIPIGTVRSRLARAREELSSRLGGSGFRGPDERGA